MKRICLPLLLLACLPAPALAMCYTVVGQGNVVIWRGTNSPINLSGTITEGMRARFPQGSHFVISYDANGCTPIGPQDFFGPLPGMNVDFSKLK